MTMLEWIVFILAIKSIIDSFTIMKIFDRLIELSEHQLLLGKVIIGICKDEKEN